MARAVHAQRDPAWTADGIVSDRWLPVSPSGRIDAFEWKVPLAELAAPAAAASEFAGEPPALIEAEQSKPVAAVEVAEPVVAAEQDAAASEPEKTAPAVPRRRRQGATVPAPASEPVRHVEAVIPLAHAPDDPGPDAPTETQP